MHQGVGRRTRAMNQGDSQGRNDWFLRGGVDESKVTMIVLATANTTEPTNQSSVSSLGRFGGR